MFCLSFCNHLSNIFIYWNALYNGTRLYLTTLLQLVEMAPCQQMIVQMTSGDTAWMNFSIISLMTSTVQDNDLSPVWCQAIIWTKAASLLNWIFRNKLQYIWIKIWSFSIKKMCSMCELGHMQLPCHNGIQVDKSSKQVTFLHTISNMKMTICKWITLPVPNSKWKITLRHSFLHISYLQSRAH